MAEQLSKETSDLVYEVVEIAKSSGKINKGTNEVTKAIEKQKAKLVIVAEDVTPPEIVMHLPLLAKEKGIKCVKTGSKADLGAAAGLSIGAGSIAIIDEGDAKTQLKKVLESLS